MGPYRQRLKLFLGGLRQLLVIVVVSKVMVTVRPMSRPFKAIPIPKAMAARGNLLINIRHWNIYLCVSSLLVTHSDKAH